MTNTKPSKKTKNTEITHSSPYQSVCSYSSWCSEYLHMKRKQNIHLGRSYFSIIQSDTPWLNITLEMIMNAGAAVSLRNNKAEYKTCTRSLLLTHALNQTHCWPTNSLERQREALKQKQKNPYIIMSTAK